MKEGGHPLGFAAKDTRSNCSQERVLGLFSGHWNSALAPDDGALWGWEPLPWLLRSNTRLGSGGVPKGKIGCAACSCGESGTAEEQVSGQDGACPKRLRHTPFRSRPHQPDKLRPLEGSPPAQMAINPKTRKPRNRGAQPRRDLILGTGVA